MQNLTETYLKLRNSLCIAGICLLGGCAGSAVLVPNPKGQSPKTQVTSEKSVVSEDKQLPPEKTKEEPSRDDELDFALAFAEPGDKSANIQPKSPLLYKVDKKGPFNTRTNQTFSVPRNLVRVALHQNLSRITVYSLGDVGITARRKKGTLSCRGRIALRGAKKKGKKATIIIETAKKGTFEVFLPCTLLARSAHNYFELKEQSYRGSLILVAGKNNTFSVINYCGVEEYLRGVVPLEIGRRSEEDIAAVMAQAIAARTYTYKRIIERSRAPFDMVATVADQVYGGVNAEYPLSDRAIKLTKGSILAYGDSLIYAYYHSTCGGITADISDVWNKHSYPYLRAIEDCDTRGKSYCSISRYYTWQESWSTSSLSAIIRRYSGRAFPQQPPFKGTIKGMSVVETYPCGRVSKCRIHSSGGTYNYGGDKIRFALRRNLSGHPILRSADFKIQHANAREIKISGRGYGHGVGMCQMGAIGRARAGQSCNEILIAYYTGASIAAVKLGASQKTLVYE